jgi:hypothetical protein
MLVDWGDGTQDTITVWNQAQRTHTYANAGDYTITIKGVCRGFQFNGGGDRLKLLNILQYGILNLSTNGVFSGCTNFNPTATDAPIISTTSFATMIRNCTNFIGNIGNQLTYLKKKGYAIPFISLEDIIVIDDIIFAFINNDKVFKIEDGEDGEDERNERNERNNHNSKNIVIDFPIKFNKKNSFIPPMIKKYFHSSTSHSSDSQKLPIIIHHSWGLYSFAQLCIFIFLKKIINDDIDYEDNAGPFIYTPLYWCLKRCLDKNNSKRILLYI